MEKNEIPTKQIPRPIPIYNVDGTLNKDRTIKEYVEIRMIIQDHVERIQFAVSNIGESDVFIGHEWLKKHNPEVLCFSLDAQMNVATSLRWTN
jgi:hypothetical protein